ncbi:hypothetical protein [Thermosporothrix hazakensis]|uniref:hypothetical protein n=1 Tax=Thermosporothrix hazakensis TaxID=644383 RepID=UPI0010F5763B|nr:hypothetical protein [Thermosporothrix hazakensis]
MLKHRADIADHETRLLSTKALQQAQVTRYLKRHQLSILLLPVSRSWWSGAFSRASRSRRSTLTRSSLRSCV